MRVDKVGGAPQYDKVPDRPRPTAPIPSPEAAKGQPSATAAESLAAPPAVDAGKDPAKAGLSKQARQPQAEAKEPVATEDTEVFEKVVEDLQGQFETSNGLSVSFELSEGDPPVVLIVRDKESGKEVRRIPPDEVNRLVKALDDLKGVIVDRMG